jgi:lipopolysaccharide export system protein LptA
MLQRLDKRFTCMLKSVMVAGALLCSVSTFAIPSDRNQPISLQADRATFNEKTGITTYSGNVLIEQGSLRLQAGSIVAHLNAANQIQTVVAQGSPAKFQQQLDAKGGLAKGEARSIHYNAETGIVKLSGQAFLSQNGATFRGENLIYSMSKGDIEASGGNGGRIQIVIPPSAQQSLKGVRE